MKIKGRLTRFNKVNNGTVILKDTAIDIPIEVPLVVNFSFAEPQSVIGSCSVTRDEIGLSIDGTIYDGIDIPKEGYIGGFYNQVCRDVDVIRSATLRAVSIVSNPCDWECTYKTEDKDVK